MPQMLTPARDSYTASSLYIPHLQTSLIARAAPRADHGLNSYALTP